jgi:hypothetical protein
LSCFVSFPTFNINSIFSVDNLANAQSKEASSNGHAQYPEKDFSSEFFEQNKSWEDCEEVHGTNESCNDIG